MLHSTRRARLRPFFHLTIWTLLLPPCCLGTESAGGLEPGSGVTNTSNGNLADQGKTVSGNFLPFCCFRVGRRLGAGQRRHKSEQGEATDPSHYESESLRIRVITEIRFANPPTEKQNSRVASSSDLQWPGLGKRARPVRGNGPG